MNRVVVTISRIVRQPKGMLGKNCNKMKNKDQMGTYVRQMTDDARAPNAVPIRRARFSRRYRSLVENIYIRNKANTNLSTRS